MAQFGSNMNWGEMLVRALENQKQMNLQKKEQAEASAARDKQLKLQEDHYKNIYNVQQRMLESEQRRTQIAETQLGFQERQVGMTEELFGRGSELLPIAEMEPYMRGIATSFQVPDKPGFIRRSDVPQIESMLEARQRSKELDLRQMLYAMQIEEMQAGQQFAGAQDVLRTEDEVRGGAVTTESGETVQLGSGIRLSDLAGYKRSLTSAGHRLPYANDFEAMLENISPKYAGRQNRFRRDPDPGTGGVFDLLDPVLSSNNKFGGRNFAEMFGQVTGIGGSRGWTPGVDILNQAEGALFALETVQNQISQGNVQGGQRSMWNPQRTLEEDVRDAINMIRPRISQYLGEQESRVNQALGTASVQSALIRQGGLASPPR